MAARADTIELLRPLTVPRDALRPPSSDNPGLGLAASLLAHALLIAGLALALQWRTQVIEDVSAELWASVPQIAAPRVEPPAPEPAAPPPVAEKAPDPPARQPPENAEHEAQIALQIARQKQQQEQQQQQQQEQQEQKQRERQQAIEQARQKKTEAQRLAEEKKREQQRQEAADLAHREALHQDQLRRISAQLGMAGSGNASSQASRSAGPSAGYAGRIKARIKPNIVLTDAAIAGNPKTEVELRVAPDGTIISRRILSSSGSKVWDDTVLRAIDRTAVLPRDIDGRVQPIMQIDFTLRE